MILPGCKRPLTTSVPPKPPADNNPAIMQFYKDCGHKGIEFEDTAWCAAFVSGFLTAIHASTV